MPASDVAHKAALIKARVLWDKGTKGGEAGRNRARVPSEFWHTNEGLAGICNKKCPLCFRLKQYTNPSPPVYIYVYFLYVIPVVPNY